MRPDPDAIEASRPGDREVALLAAEVRRLQAVIASEEPALTDAEREAVERAVATADDYHDDSVAATLRGLLEKHK